MCTPRFVPPRLLTSVYRHSHPHTHTSTPSKTLEKPVEVRNVQETIFFFPKEKVETLVRTDVTQQGAVTAVGRIVFPSPYGPFVGVSTVHVHPL